MRLLRLLLAVFVLASGLVVVTSGPALACSCAVGSTRDHLDGAHAVLTGTLVEIKDPPTKLFVSSTDPVTYTVTVDSVFKGDVGPDVVFTSARSGASCGLEG